MKGIALTDKNRLAILQSCNITKERLNEMLADFDGPGKIPLVFIPETESGSWATVPFTAWDEFFEPVRAFDLLFHFTDITPKPAWVELMKATH